MLQIQSLYPEKMGPDVISIDDFLVSGLTWLDKEIEHRVWTASSNGNGLRYVCVLEGSRCEVGIQELPKNSPLWRLRGSDNVVEIYSQCYKEQLLVIQVLVLAMTRLLLSPSGYSWYSRFFLSSLNFQSQVDEVQEPNLKKVCNYFQISLCITAKRLCCNCFLLLCVTCLVKLWV